MNIRPTFRQHFTAKTLTKCFLLYSYRPREGTARLHTTAVSKALSTEHNKTAVFHQSRLQYNLSAVIHQKGPSPYKKAEIVLQFLENFRHSKRILEPVFLDIAERIFSAHFGNYVAKPKTSGVHLRL